MMKLSESIALLSLSTIFLAGCSSGDGPSPPGNDNAVNDAMKTMSKEDKIKFYKNSPLPPAEKAAKLKELGAEPDPVNPSGAPKSSPLKTLLVRLS